MCANRRKDCQDCQASLLHYAFQASSCQSIGLQQMLSSTSIFSYMMPSKPLAAKASVFKLPKQLSSTATSHMISRRQSLRNQTSPKTDFTAIFLKCWASSMATLWAWRVHLGFVRTSPAGGESGQEISSTTLPVPPPAPAAPAPAAGENGDRPADEPPTPPAAPGGF